MRPDCQNISATLRTTTLGRRCVYADQLPSTNRTALELGLAGEAEGLLVVAETQTAGRGRQTRLWFSPPEANLYFSLLLRPQLPTRRLPELAMLCALALRRAIREICPSLNPGLKWPNDLHLHGRKISGILCECGSRPEQGVFAVAGIGLNVNLLPEDFPQELQMTAGSLRACTGTPVDRAALLAAILNHLEPLYREWQQSDDLAPFLPEWQQGDILAGKRIRVQEVQRQLEGTVCGVAPDGRLLLRTDDGAVCRITAGDTHLLPTAAAAEPSPAAP